MCKSKKPDETEPVEQITKEQLELMMLANNINYSKQLYATNDNNTAALHEVALKQAHTQLKITDLHLVANQLAMRPHKAYHADISYCPTEGKYMCRLPVMFEADDDMMETTPVAAYGDTAAQAADNFDYMWVHGTDRPNGDKNV